MNDNFTLLDTKFRYRNPTGDWSDQAACRGMDINIFFPGQGQDVREAKAVCRACPVREDCKRYAYENREMFGVWGGTTEKERKRARGRKQAA